MRMVAQNKRDLSIDLIKIVAMLGVIALHSTMQFITPGETHVADILYDMGVISMPLFFMVSGYLLIPRGVDYRYVLRKTLNIIRFVAFVVFTYWIAYSVAKGFSINLFFEWFLGSFVQYGPLNVFWYFGAIIICYLMLPFISKLYQRKKPLFMGLLCSLGLLCSIMFSTTLISSVVGEVIELRIPATFRLWYVLFYFLLGGALFYYNMKIPLYVVITIGLATIIYKEYFDKIIGSEYASIFYSSLLVMVLVYGVFQCLRSVTITKEKIIKQLSELFLPVYAIHMFVIKYRPHFYDSYGEIAPIINYIIISVVSIILSLIIMKIPFVKNLFKI